MQTPQYIVRFTQYIPYLNKNQDKCRYLHFAAFGILDKRLVSLLFEGKLEQKQADVILATLFTKADTGLLKNDSGSEIDLFTKLFSMMK